MNMIQNRLRLVRKNLSLSQDEFGKVIGLSRSQIGCYEKGIRDVTERSLNDICREFNVNKEWLLNGVGKMYNEQDTNLSELLTTISNSNNPQLKEVIIKLAKVDATYINSINTLLDGILNESN